jgi:diguanylate cyclase (GGDEF)-like protein
MEFFEQTERMQTDNFFTTYLMIDLEGVKSMKEMADAVENNIHCLGPYIRFHMCLCQGIDETRTDRLEGFTDEMQLYMTMERDKHVVISGDTFHKDFLLPDSVITEEPQIYYFLPLHFKETIFGYTAISFENGDAYKQNYQSWMIGLGNAIENISIHRKMQHLIDNLQDLYIRDELTGLYNRRGFEKFGEELFYKAKTENKYVYVIALDLDGLKTINDDFGHAHGDIAIKAVAEAIKNASINHEISARMGGDEYSVIGIADMNAEKYAIDFLRIFNKHIDMVNRDFAAEYVIGASYGTSYKNPEDDTELEFHMNKSDDAMYQMKASRKER